MRTPKEIATDMAALSEKAKKAFVPMDVKHAAELSAEFAASVVVALDALAAKTAAKPKR